MNKGQQILAAMLAIVIVVLGLVAFAPQPKPPTVVAGGSEDVAGSLFLYRYWSDGQIDVTRVLLVDECVIDSPCGPTVVVVE